MNKKRISSSLKKDFFLALLVPIMLLFIYMIKILGKIDLESIPKERPQFKAEKYKPLLDKKINELSTHLNNEYANIFMSDCSVSLSNESDIEFVKEREDTWSKEMGKSKETWLKDKELNKSSLAETAITLLLDKALKDNFLVCKSSKYDDYKHGVDNIILDKETGNIVCGFDDVLGHSGDDGGEKKKDKIRKIMEKGGVSLKQGLSFKEDGSLQVKELHNLPALYLGISKEDLESLLEGLNTDSKEMNEIEKNLIFKFIKSMDEQLESFKFDNLNSKLETNILEFEKSLKKIKSII
ncbi:MAG: hypothetical protein ACLFNO_00635 [Parcubacteria group bacterium]